MNDIGGGGGDNPMCERMSRSRYRKIQPPSVATTPPPSEATTPPPSEATTPTRGTPITSPVSTPIHSPSRKKPKLSDKEGGGRM